MPANGLLAIPAHVAPGSDDALDHVLFALKHEGVNLQILAQALRKLPADRMLAAVRQTPNGQYIRIAAFLWEHFNDERLPERPGDCGGVCRCLRPGALSSPDGPTGIRDGASISMGWARWRIARRSGARRRSKAGMASDILGRADAFMGSLGSTMLDRALAWAYLHETEDSYAIEHETPSEEKRVRSCNCSIKRTKDASLTEDYLAELQSSTVTNPFDQASQFRNEQELAARPRARRKRGHLCAAMAKNWSNP
ncbi:hypothetical protein ACTMU2_01745 [Cupriavidus basilensis]